MEILAPASVENGEEFNVTLVLMPAEAITVEVLAEALFIAGPVQHESHEATEHSFGAWARDVSVLGGSEERLTFTMTVPETLSGEFLVYAKAGDSESSKRVGIDFRPLTISLNASLLSEGRPGVITVRSFENESVTKFTVTKDSKEELLSKSMGGKTLYTTQLQLSSPGTYEFRAVMESPDGRVLDEDVARVVVEGYDSVPAFIVGGFMLAVLLGVGEKLLRKKEL